MVHSSGGRERQWALVLLKEWWETGGGESYWGEEISADGENDGGAKQDDYTEIKLCPLNIFP